MAPLTNSSWEKLESIITGIDLVASSDFKTFKMSFPEISGKT
jgi:hypothetical protein